MRAERPKKKPGIRHMDEHEIVVHIKQISQWLDKMHEETGRKVYKLTSVRYGKIANDIHPKGRKTSLSMRDMAYYSTVLYNLLYYWPLRGDGRWTCSSSEGGLFTVKFRLRGHDKEDE